jgi:hypothetical protein
MRKNRYETLKNFLIANLESAIVVYAGTYVYQGVIMNDVEKDSFRQKELKQIEDT